MLVVAVVQVLLVQMVIHKLLVRVMVVMGWLLKLFHHHHLLTLVTVIIGLVVAVVEHIHLQLVEMVDEVEEVVVLVNLLADQLVLPEQMDSTRVLMEQLVMVLMVVMVVYPLVVVPVDLHTKVEEVDLVVLVLL